MLFLKKLVAGSLFCFSFLAINSVAFGQNGNTISVNNKKVVLSSNISSWVEANVKSSTSGKTLVLVQFDKILSASEKEQLKTNGISIQEYLGTTLYSAVVSSNTNFNAKPVLKGISAFLPEYKIAPSVMEKAGTQQTLEVLLTFFKEVSLAEIESAIATSGATLLPNKWQSRGFYKVQVSSSQLKNLASFYGVQYIGEPSQNIPLDLDSKGAEGARILSMPTGLGGSGLRGKDVSVGIGDNCSGIYHIDQKDRVINYNNGDLQKHGVFVNGILGGDGIVDPAGQGVASDGTVISLYFDAVLLLKDELFKGFNATLTNNSYAAIVGNCAYAGTYDVLSQDLDAMALKLPEQLDVFAAGNDGGMTCGSYPTGFANLCGGYQTAKNILTVGSCFRDLKISNTSGKGPIRDGRLKPEICAAGAQVYSTILDNTYELNSGTSFACPQVTGVLALLTERYKQLNGINPKSDLLKAIAINGATDFGRPGPDYGYGFGFINGARSVGIIEKNHFARNKILTAGTTQTFAITVPANTAQLKVLMYYHDIAASPSSTVQLVTDLDLAVIEPGGAVRRPLILNPSTATVASNAAEGLDRLNNVEQVVINNPAIGSYTISVSDFALPAGAQDYVIAYDFVPNELKLLFPIANSAAAANTDMYIYWEAPSFDAGTTQIEFSSDNGGSWTTIATGIAANTCMYKWAVPLINSNQCKMRISSGSKTFTSGSFMINQQPVFSVNPIQCPGSIVVNWSAVPGADKYYMLLKKGAHLEKVDSVSGSTTIYRYTGLKINEEYWVSVLPSTGGMDGYRSKAVSRKPIDGSCVGGVDGDLALDALISPVSGRRFTSSELKSNSQIKVNIRNQDDAPVTSYSVSYKVNAGSWKTIPGFSISANTNILQVIDSFNFSDTIEYKITLAVKNTERPDPVPANDTLIQYIKHIPNKPVNLITTVSNDFEALPDLTLDSDTTGLTKDGFWDYRNSNDTGRLRTRIPGSKLVKTNRSISLDVVKNAKRVFNFFTGTFNLKNYDTSADEVRFDFEYEMRGMPFIRDSNMVWVRGSDTAKWIVAYVYENTTDTAKLHHSGTLSLRDLFRSKGQNFSSSSQIRFGQYDTTLIVDDFYGGGLTIDNVNLYKVSKDVQLTDIIAPISSDCDISVSPVTIKIKNGTITPMPVISASYSLDGKPVVKEFLSSGLAGGDSVVYTFSSILSGLSFGAHSLKVWINSAGDDFLKNDTIENYIFHISPIISNFPHIENFEVSKGDWYVMGRNASWAWGAPSAGKINKAASGKNAWKTNLAGTYNSYELSYLVSPCINTASLANPMISFSTAFNIEHCDASDCDRAYLEYSVNNGKVWNKLGTNSAGTNWYNNDKSNVWDGDQSRWHVATTALPNVPQLKLRFVMNSDAGTNLEGFAIDDIHIYDLKNQIAFTDADKVSEATPLIVNGTGWFYFLQSNRLISALDPMLQNLGQIKASAYGHQNQVDPANRQYFIHKNWVVHRDIAARTKSNVRLYIPDVEVNRMLSDTNCKTCSRPEDIYRAGVSQYYANDGKNEDSSLLNNTNGIYTYRKFDEVKWVPYDIGYYAELESNGLGEYWLNDGGILGSLPVNTQYVHLDGNKINDQQAELSWVSPIDTQMNKFQLEQSTDNVNFNMIAEVSSLKSVTNKYVKTDNPNLPENSTVYYRLFCTAENGKTFYSNTVSIQWTKGYQLLNVYPVPSTDGGITLKWTAPAGSVANYNLTDVSGRVVSSSELIASGWNNTSVLQFNYLAKGMYYLKIQIGENKYTEKLMFK